jgi:hypothetical protein
MLKKYKVFRRIVTINKARYTDAPPSIWTDHPEGIEDRIFDEIIEVRNRGFCDVKDGDQITVIPWHAVSSLTFDIMEV